MSTTITVYAAPVMEECLALNGGGRGRSHRINQVADRYLEIITHTAPLELSEGE